MCPQLLFCPRREIARVASCFAGGVFGGRGQRRRPFSPGDFNDNLRLVGARRRNRSRVQSLGRRAELRRQRHLCRLHWLQCDELDAVCVRPWRQDGHAADCTDDTHSDERDVRGWRTSACRRWNHGDLQGRHEQHRRRRCGRRPAIRSGWQRHAARTRGRGHARRGCGQRYPNRRCRHRHCCLLREVCRLLACGKHGRQPDGYRCQWGGWR